VPRLLAMGRLPVERLFPLTVLYLVDGILFASWVVRIPAIKEQVGASETALGFALLCMTASLTVAMYAGGHLCERLGTRTVIVAGFPFWADSIVLPAFARTPVQLGAILLVLGATYGGLAVALNAAAVEIEKATGRAVMSPMHGLWSLGGLVGAVIGGLLATRLSTFGHLGVVAAGALIVAAAGGPLLLRAPQRQVRADRGPRSTPPPAPTAVPDHQATDQRTTEQQVRTAVVLFGIVALCTAYGEGAVGDWAALHLRDVLGTTAGVAAYGFGAYSVAIAAGRLGGGWLVTRLGETTVVSGGGLLAALGVVVTAWTSDLAFAFVGLVAIGLGLANMFPVVMARAGALGGPRGVGLASTIGTTGMLVGPPVLGFLAGQFGLRTALTTVAVVASLAAVLGLVVRAYVRRIPSGDHDRDHEGVAGQATRTPS
jgi:MFS family permease